VHRKMGVIRGQKRTSKLAGGYEELDLAPGRAARAKRPSAAPLQTAAGAGVLVDVPRTGTFTYR
jgi:hypothetical protein